MIHTWQYIRCYSHKVFKMVNWSEWRRMPSPDLCREIKGPTGPGVYQIRNFKTLEYIQFGIGVECQKRMKSLFPKPFGVGTRNNENKRIHVLQNWHQLEYRTASTSSRGEAKGIEDQLKAGNNHRFNT